MKFIDRTIEILQTYGWCTGTFHDERGRYCVVGAMRKARNEAIDGGRGSEEYVRARAAFEKLIMEEQRQAGAVDLMDAMGWNDNIAPDADAVLHMLKRAGEQVDLAAERVS